MTKETSVHREERQLPLDYDRVAALAPVILAKAAGAEVATLGDGFYVARTKLFGGAREVVVRLGRSGADTRVEVRAETISGPWVKLLGVAFVCATFGVGLLLLLVIFASAARDEARKRELLVHATLRALEEAVASPGGSYRVAPYSEDAQVRRDAAIEEAAPSSADGATPRASS